jgi:hypothetical protein
MTDQNPLAGILDTLFNGRPAPTSAKAQTVRIKLNQENLASLLQGDTVKFQAGPILIELVQSRSHR